MLLWPDIIVRKPDSSEVLLAIEIKLGSVSAEAAMNPLKAYMVRQGCPAGIFVTPEEVTFLRNRYTSYEQDSIQTIAKCRTAELLGTFQGKTITESALVHLVEHWLENPGTGGRKSLPPDVTEAIESLVLPAVTEGGIQATGRRLQPTGS
jgi:hypothetical protein